MNSAGEDPLDARSSADAGDADRSPWVSSIDLAVREVEALIRRRGLEKVDREVRRVCRRLVSELVGAEVEASEAAFIGDQMQLWFAMEDAGEARRLAAGALSQVASGAMLRAVARRRRSAPAGQDGE